MISSLGPREQQFLANLERIAARQNLAQRRVSTGLRVSQVSDDPDQISTLLTARAHLAATQQVQTNLGRVKAEVDTADQVLQQAISLFEHIRTVGAQGNSATQTAQTRASLAQEAGSTLEQLVGIAGTSVEGRHIFSGDSDQASPYAIDLTQTRPVSAYQGAAATRQAQHPNGTTFAVAHTAQEIFDSADPATNVFQTANALRVALAANDDAAIAAAVGALTAAGEYLNSQAAFYGATHNRIAEALDYGSAFQIQLQTQISALTDADLTEAIVDMNQANTQQQAALQSWARLPRTTLFDFLG
jgi:flagellar hook-associated protein 3 FlgL